MPTATRTFAGVETSCFRPRMRPTARHVVVLVTAPDLETARTLAQAALEARLIACSNLIPALESHYWWQGKLESGAEVLLLLKTTRPRLAALEALILGRHPFDTPEFLVLPATAGSARYLDWITATVAKPPKARGSVRSRRRA